MREKSDDIRVWHYLTKNKVTSTPTLCMWVDTETNGVPVEGNPNASIQILKLWCARWCKLSKGKTRHYNSTYGTTVESFWDLVSDTMSTHRPLWLFAHNVGFDLTVLRFWELLESGLFRLGDNPTGTDSHGVDWDKHKWHGFAVLDDPPTIIECRQSGTFKTLIICDTYNYFRSSVKTLGESIGLEKMLMPNEDDRTDAWLEYCMRDVQIIEQAITKLMSFVQKNDLGKWRYTAPAQAFSAYRHRFMKHRILIHGNKDAIALEREAYYGGRLENHFIGRVIADKAKDGQLLLGPGDIAESERIGPIYVLDINSCYPAMMLWHMFPTKIKDLIIQPSITELENITREFATVARVTINDLLETYPVHRNGKTFMSSGRFVTSLCGPELHRALQRCSVKNVGAVAVYEQQDLFSKYVSFFWNERQGYKEHGDKANAEWCKLMLNSLGGKFGQRARKWDDRDDLLSPMPWGMFSRVNTETNERKNYRSLAWAVQEEQDAGESIDSFPAISGYITSYAREYINKIIESAGYENVYYVDTDCVHCNQLGYDSLLRINRISGNELGMLGVRGVYQTAEYRGLKDYSLDNNHTISGVKTNADNVRAGLFRQDQFQRLGSILAGQIPIGVRVDRVTIDRRIGLDPQRIQPDGSVKPQVLWE